MSFRTKRIRLLAVLAVFSLVPLTACGDTAETTVTTAPATAEAPATTQAPATTVAPTTEATPTTEAAPTTEATTTMPIDEFAVLAGHITDSLAEWKPVIGASDLFDNLSDGDESNDPYILSVRAPDAYALGHIEGAYNIPWKQIADPSMLATLPTDQPIVVYCYTGHTGQVAATLLRLFGYDAINLKYGMMGWTADDEVLATDRYTGAPGYPTETEANVATETYALPALATGEAEASKIALTAAQELLADWTPVTTAETLFENMSDGDDTNDFYVLSVRAEDAYALGHVGDAFNIGWKAVATEDALASLPTDQAIMVYCYTGHTGQVATTALALLGYDVINMKYGMMGWTDDDEILATDRYTGAPDYPTTTET